MAADDADPPTQESRQPYLAIFVALRQEAGPLLGRLRTPKKLPFAFACRIGDIAKKRILITVTGVGMARAMHAANTVLDRYTPKRILCAGFAGATNSTFQEGDIVVADAVWQEHEDHSYAQVVYQPDATCIAELQQSVRQFPVASHTAALATCRHAVLDAKRKQGMAARYQLDAVDMETAAISQTAESRRIPYACLRAVTDRADETLPAGLPNLIGVHGQASLRKAIGLLAKNPGQLPAMLDLRKRSSIAAEHLTAAICAWLHHAA